MRAREEPQSPRGILDVFNCVKGRHVSYKQRLTVKMTPRRINGTHRLKYIYDRKVHRMI